jgi:hypothetical protein
MAITGTRGTFETYTPEEDVTETLPDGRTIQVAVKGVPMAMSDAQKWGLVKAPKTQGPSEKKPGESPTEVKSVAEMAGSALLESPVVADADAGEDAEADVEEAPAPEPAPEPAPAPAPKPSAAKAKK